MAGRVIKGAAPLPVRIQNLTGDQTVRAAPCILRSLTVSNANAAVQTLTLKDGSTVRNVVRVPAGASFSPDLGPDGLRFDTSLVVTPSAVEIDAMLGVQ